MGRIAAELADVAIVTSDNPRSEDPLAIIDEIVAGRTGDSRSSPTGAPRSSRRSRSRRAGRRRRDRRQGARAGPGVRRTGRCRSTTARSRARSSARLGAPRVIPLARRGAGRSGGSTRAPGPTRSPASRSTRAASRRATCSSRSAAARDFVEARVRARRGRGARPGRRLRRARGARQRRARRARPRVVGDHRLDRQDLDEGHPRRALRARTRDGRRRGGLQQRDRPAADPAPARARHRDLRRRDGRCAASARSRELCAIARPRRRRDHRRRPGPPRAARHGRGRRAGEGGAPRLPAGRRRRGRPGATPCWSRTCGRRPRRSAVRRGRRASSSSRRPDRVDVRSAASVELRFRSPRATRPRTRCAAARRRGARPPARPARRARRGRALALARRGARAARRRPR